MDVNTYLPGGIMMMKDNKRSLAQRSFQLFLLYAVVFGGGKCLKINQH